jgi:hypothetical protein
MKPEPVVTVAITFPLTVSVFSKFASAANIAAGIIMIPAAHTRLRHPVFMFFSVDFI